MNKINNFIRNVIIAFLLFISCLFASVENVQIYRDDYIILSYKNEAKFITKIGLNFNEL